MTLCEKQKKEGGGGEEEGEGEEEEEEEEGVEERFLANCGRCAEELDVFRSVRLHHKLWYFCYTHWSVTSLGILFPFVVIKEICRAIYAFNKSFLVSVFLVEQKTGGREIHIV